MLCCCSYDFVTKVKERFAKDPNAYKDFLKALHKFQMEHRSVDIASAQVRILFAGHPDLISEFSKFLPAAASASDSSSAHPVTSPSSSCAPVANKVPELDCSNSALGQSISLLQQGFSAMNFAPLPKSPVLTAAVQTRMAPLISY